MTETEAAYLLNRAADVAETCIALGCPQHIRSFIVEGYDGAGVRRAMAGTLPAAKPQAADQRSQRATAETADQAAADWRTPALKAAADARFASQSGDAPAAA